MNNTVRCEGYIRHGGAFTIGLPEWKQCEADATVLIKFKKDGKIETLPSCPICWDRCIQAESIKIIEVTPIVAPPDELFIKENGIVLEDFPN